MKTLVFAGSNRSNSLNKKLARFAAEELQRAGIEVTVAELTDFPMPLYDGDLEIEAGLPESARAFKQLLREHDSLVIASPEYNGSFPALLKNTVDWISRPEPGERPSEVFQNKTAALLSTSPGAGGGRRGLRHLRELMQNLGVSVISTEVAVARGSDAFDTNGRLVRADAVDQVRQLVADLASAVNQAREAAA
jgi:chromate reductase, NAD(P)H dehydrogenase (quinone)